MVGRAPVRQLDALEERRAVEGGVEARGGDAERQREPRVRARRHRPRLSDHVTVVQQPARRRAPGAPRRGGSPGQSSRHSPLPELPSTMSGPTIAAVRSEKQTHTPSEWNGDAGPPAEPSRPVVAAVAAVAAVLAARRSLAPPFGGGGALGLRRDVLLLPLAAPSSSSSRARSASRPPRGASPT